MVPSAFGVVSFKVQTAVGARVALARWLLSSAASTWLERPGFVPRRSGTRAEEDQVLPLLERVITPGTDGLGGPGGGVPALAGGRRCRSRRRESAGEFRAVLRMLHVATTLPRIQIRLFPIYRTLFRFPSNV